MGFVGAPGDGPGRTPTDLSMTDIDTPLRGTILVVTGPSLDHELHRFFQIPKPMRAAELGCNETVKYEL